MPDLPPAYLPFGNLAPDLGAVSMAGEDPSRLLLAISAWPHGQTGWVPARDLVSQGMGTVAGEPTGSCLFSKNYVYYGTAGGQIVEADYAAGTVTARYTAPTSGYATVRSWREDNSAGTFTDITTDVNDVGGPDAQPWPAAPAINDTVYFGYSAPQTSLSINVGTAATGTYTVSWLYSAAAGMTALSSVTDGTNAFKVAGTNTVTFTQPNDHVATSIGGYVAFWYALRITAFSAMAVNPVLTQVSGNFAHTRNWSMTRFGDVVIATNEWDPVQVQATRGAAFAALITSTDKPQARYCTHYRGRLVLGHLRIVDETSNFGARGRYPYSIWMSGIQAAQNFDPTDLTALSQFQTLPTKYGEITGLAEVDDQLPVFFENAVYRVADTGIFALSLGFVPIVGARGTTHPRSIVVDGGVAYYWGPSGPAAVAPSGYVELAADQLTTTLLAGSWPLPIQISLDSTQDEPKVIGSSMSKGNFIIWRYPVTDAAYLEALLVWNRRTGRFGFIPIVSSGPTTPSIRFIEDRGDVSSEQWELGATLALGMYNGTSTEIYKFNASFGAQAGVAGGSGLTTATRFVLSYLEIDPSQITRPTALQLIASPSLSSTGLPALSVKINARRDPSAPVAADNTVTITTSNVVVTDGWMPLMADVGGTTKSAARGRYHQPDITITPSATFEASEVQGARLRYDLCGDY